MTYDLPREQLPRVAGRVGVQAGGGDPGNMATDGIRGQTPGPGQVLPPSGGLGPRQAGQLPTQPDAFRVGLRPGRKAQGAVLWEEDKSGLSPEN